MLHNVCLNAKYKYINNANAHTSNCTFRTIHSTASLFHSEVIALMYKTPIYTQKW